MRLGANVRSVEKLTYREIDRAVE